MGHIRRVVSADVPMIEIQTIWEECIKRGVAKSASERVQMAEIITTLEQLLQSLDNRECLQRYSSVQMLQDDEQVRRLKQLKTELNIH